MSKVHSLIRRRRLLPTLGIAALALAAASYAMSSPRAEPAAQHGAIGREDHGDVLEQAMQSMQGAQKRLEKALEKKDLTAALPLVVEMQRAALSAKAETPPTAREITDEKKKAEFVTGFRKQLILLQKGLCDLELAAIDGKADDATRIYEGVIKPTKKEGHAKYKGD